MALRYLVDCENSSIEDAIDEKSGCDMPYAPM